MENHSQPCCISKAEIGQSSCRHGRAEALVTYTYLEKMHNGFHSSVNLREGIRGPEKNYIYSGWMDG